MGAPIYRSVWSRAGTVGYRFLTELRGGRNRQSKRAEKGNRTFGEGVHRVPLSLKIDVAVSNIGATKRGATGQFAGLAKRADTHGC